MPDGASKRGRQRTGAGEKPRPVLSFRVQAELHARLRASAEANELAMSEEVERRLQRSFDAETLEATLRHVVRAEIAEALRPIRSLLVSDALRQALRTAPLPVFGNHDEPVAGMQ